MLVHDAAAFMTDAYPVVPVDLLGTWSIPHPQLVLGDAVQLEYLSRDRETRRVPVQNAAVEDILFGVPVRTPKPHRGARNRLGQYWSEALIPSEEGDLDIWHLVQLESRLEGRFALCADFDPGVLACVPQPFTIRAPGRASHSHTPDFLTVRDDGTVVVYDIRPKDRIDDQARAQFDDTATVLAMAGWSHVVWNDVSDRHFELIDWFGRVRVPGSAHEWLIARANRLVNNDCYGSLRHKLLSEAAPAVFIQPAIDTLLWRHHLVVDWDKPLDEDSILHPGPGPGRRLTAVPRPITIPTARRGLGA